MWSMKLARAIVAPLVTFGLTGSFVYASLFQQDAVEHLKELTFVAVTFWFAERAVRREE